MTWTLFAIGLACKTEAPPKEPERERPLALLYTHNLDGETEPCG